MSFVIQNVWCIKSSSSDTTCCTIENSRVIIVNFKTDPENCSNFPLNNWIAPTELGMSRAAKWALLLNLFPLHSEERRLHFWIANLWFQPLIYTYSIICYLSSSKLTKGQACVTSPLLNLMSHTLVLRRPCSKGDSLSFFFFSSFVPGWNIHAL